MADGPNVLSRRRPRMVALVVGAVCLIVAAWGWRNHVLSTPLDDGSDTEYLTDLVIQSDSRTAGRGVVADHAQALRDDDLVIGVKIGREARAYPVRSLTSFEHVNDTIGDTPICVTWCSRAASGVVWDRRVGGKVLKFAFHPFSFDGNLMLWDSTTQSIWSQLGLRALDGPLKGRRLRPLPAVQTTWGQWREMEPSTRVFLLDSLAERKYRYRRAPRNGARSKQRLHRFDLVLGIESGDSAKAYPFGELAEAPDPISDRVGNQTVRIHFDAESGSAWGTGQDGGLLAAVTVYWGAWRRFHPRSKVYQAEDATLR